MAIETRSGRLKWARERLYPSAAEFARRLEMSDITYRAHENGLRDYREPAAKRYGAHLKVNWAWLLTGEGTPLLQETTASTLTQSRPNKPDTAAMSFAEPGPELPPTPLQRRDSEPRLIPIFAATALQNGSFQMGPTVADMAECPPPLRHVADACAVYCVGESMAPVYRQGDLLFLHPYYPPAAGHDILCCRVRPQTGTLAQIGRTVSWSDTHIHIQQFGHNQFAHLNLEEWKVNYMIIGKYNFRV